MNETYWTPPNMDNFGHNLDRAVEIAAEALNDRIDEWFSVYGALDWDDYHAYARNVRDAVQFAVESMEAIETYRAFRKGSHRYLRDLFTGSDQQ